MNNPSTVQPLRHSGRSRLPAALALLVLFVVSCSDSASIPGAVADQFDRNGSIADLTQAGQEDVPRVELLQATSRARELGTELRIVIAGVDDELVSASAIVSRYGGTALSYKANDTRFEAASEDIHSDLIDQAIGPAGESGDLGASANAFVDVLEAEGLRSPGRRWWPPVAIALLAASLAFVAIQAFRLVRARKQANKRRADFDNRKQVLRDWAERLAPEVDALASRASNGGESAQQTLHEALDFSTRIVAKVDEATTMGDLDAAEMRLGRNYIKLRDLRAELDRRG